MANDKYEPRVIIAKENGKAYIHVIPTKEWEKFTINHYKEKIMHNYQLTKDLFEEAISLTAYHGTSFETVKDKVNSLVAQLKKAEAEAGVKK